MTLSELLAEFRAIEALIIERDDKRLSVFGAVENIHAALRQKCLDAIAAEQITGPADEAS